MNKTKNKYKKYEFCDDMACKYFDRDNQICNAIDCIHTMRYFYRWLVDIHEYEIVKEAIDDI